MVIDAAKGIEPQTRKLFEVCRLRACRSSPSSTRSIARGARSFELLDEIADMLALDVCPMTGRSGWAAEFEGVLDLAPAASAARRRQPDLPGQDRRRSRRCPGATGGGDRAGAQDRLSRVRRRGLSQRRPDAGLFRLRAQGFRRRRADRRARRLSRRRRARSPPNPRRSPRDARGHRLRLQGPGQHGPQPPRPHRLHAAMFGHLQTRHEADALGLTASRSRSIRRSCSSRRIANSPTRRSRATSSASPTTARCAWATRCPRRTGGALHRPAQFRARNPAPRPAEGPDQDQAAAQGAGRPGRRGRDPGLLPRDRQQLDHRRRRRPAPARGCASSGRRNGRRATPP
jgi:hypothetical protein